MSSPKRLVCVSVVLLMGIAMVGVRMAVRAHKNLVTLNVRNMEVRDVIRKIEWQTWEQVLVNSAVKGKVTLNVRNAPLDAVLELVAGQVSARSSRVYPVYLTKQSLKAFKAKLELDPSNLSQMVGWTNLSLRGGPMRGMFGRGPDSQGAATNHTLNLAFENKTPALAALTLSAAAGAQVVPEDGIELRVNLEIRHATPDQAIQQFATTLHRKTESLYVLRGGRFDGERAQGEMDEEAMKARMEARLAALNPEERRRMEEMRNLTPEERQARMQERMQDPAAQQKMIERSLDGIRNSTPEQIVQRKRDRQQMRNSQQRGQGGGFNRPQQ